MEPTVRAIIQEKYGDPQGLKLKDIPKPTPKSDEVLVKIKATSVNDYDWSLVRGKPYIYRLMFGLNSPKSPTPGMEFAGIVEQVGSDASNFKVGDRVYGDSSDDKFGTYAEYFCAQKNSLVKMPENLSFENAAATPHACLLAVQALKDIAKIREHQKILINGAGGGVGHFALHYSKLFDAHVTGVDASHKHAPMKEAGFDATLDYTTTDFTKVRQEFDIILDTKSQKYPWQYLSVLTPKGTYVSVGGYLPNILYLALLGPLLKKTTGKSISVLALKPNSGLDELNSLINEEKLFCPIDGPYSLEEAPNPQITDRALSAEF